MKIDYNQYRFSKQEVLRFTLEAIGIGIIVNYLCYQTIWGIPLMVLFIFFYLKKKKTVMINKQKNKLNLQFKDAVHSLSVALNAGYSMENAIGESIKDMRNIYTPKEPIVRELLFIQSQIKVSVPVETLFMDLGNRSGVEDIQNFASVYTIAKRSGGNVNQILEKAARMIEEKIETQQEIAAAVAAKQLEQSVMSLVPCGIILYMQFASPGFLDVLYGNVLGVVLMTVCLGIYLGAYRVGKKIVEIEV